MKRLFFLVFTGLLPAWAVAQLQLHLLDGPEFVCPERPLPIGFRVISQVNERFGTGNRFVVQFSRDGNAWNDAPTDGGSSPLVVHLPEGFRPGNEGYYRVTSTDPVRQTSFRKFTVVGPATAELWDTLLYRNRFESMSFPIRLAGGGPYTLTFSDSVRQTWGVGQTVVSRSLLVDGSQEMRVSRVQNACGDGQTRGNVRIRVSEVAVSITQLTPRQSCAGGEILLGYSAQEDFPAEAVVRVALVRVTSGGQATGETRVVPARREATVVRARLPIDLASGSYRAYVECEQPSLRASFERGLLFVSSRPEIRLTGQAEVFLGEKAELGIAAQGLGMQVTLSDGSEHPLGDNQEFLDPANPFTRKIQVTPRQSQTYRITSARSACGEPLTGGEARVTVLPALLIDSLPVKPVCAGTTVGFAHRGTLGGQSSFTLRFVRTDSERFPFTYELEARVVSPSRFEVTLPIFMQAGMYKVQPAGVARGPEKGFMTINGRPDAELTNDGTEVRLAAPQRVELPLTIRSGGAGLYRLALSDGSEFEFEGKFFDRTGLTVPVMIRQTTTLELRSVSNQCTTGLTSNIKRYVVANTSEPAILLQHSGERRAGCPAGPLRIRYQATGSYDSSNVFRVELSDGNGRWTGNYLFSEKTTSFDKLTAFPSASGTYALRVVSTSPARPSAEVPLWVKAEKPSAEIRGLNYYAAGTPLFNQPSAEISPGERVELELLLSGNSLLEYRLSDGTSGVLVGLVGTTDGTRVVVNPTKNTAYRVVSVTDACNQTTRYDLGREFPVRVNAYGFSAQLRPLDYNATFCTETPMRFSAQITGTLPPDVSWKIQISDQNVTPRFTDLPTRGNNPFEADVPRLSSDRSVQFRLVATVGTETFYSPPTPAYVFNNKPLLARLTTPDNQTEVKLDTGKALSLRIAVTGSRNTRAVLSDLTQETLTDTVLTVLRRPNRSTTYRLLAVSNECGYALVGGAVSALLPGQISRAEVRAGVACVGQTVDVAYETTGLFEAGNRFGLTLRRGDLEVDVTPTSQATGVVSFVPQLAQAGRWQVVMTATAPRTSRVVGELSIQTPVVARLVTSESSVYAGQPALLFVTLSDGAQLIWEHGLVSTFNTGGVHPSEVRPERTTTYRLKAVSNACGEGQAVGQAVVNVLPPAERRLEVLDAPEYVCLGKAFYARYRATGDFSGTTFRLELSDAEGRNYGPIATQPTDRGVDREVKATLPSAVVPGRGYRLRFVSENPTVVGTSSPLMMEVTSPPTATLAGPDSVFFGQPVTLLVSFTGAPPWDFTLTADAETLNARAFTSPVALSFEAKSPLTFRLTFVRNERCGVGTPGPVATYRLTVITSTEPQAGRFRVFPNPTRDRLRVELPEAVGLSARWRVCAPDGRVVRRGEARLTGSPPGLELSLDDLPGGVWLLTINAEGTATTVKIVKQ